MHTRLHLQMLPQPDDITCGPTCLHAVYSYYGLELDLDQLITTLPSLKGGGTLSVWLANDALLRGYRARIYTFNLNLFDPSWFALPVAEISDRLRRQAEAKEDPKLELACHAYVEFLQLGGELRLEDLTLGLIRRHLQRGVPILTGLSSTYLYRKPREFGPGDDDDDIRGEPQGHFVVLCGYDALSRSVAVADPFLANPVAPSQYYSVPIERAQCAILLGIVTYDANLLVIEPKRPHRSRHAHPGRGRQH